MGAIHREILGKVNNGLLQECCCCCDFFFLIDGTVFLIDLYTSRSILMKTRTKERRIRTMRD